MILLGGLAVVLGLMSILILRQLYHNAASRAYCAGWRDGVAYTATRTKQPEPRGRIRTVLSMN